MKRTILIAVIMLVSIQSLHAAIVIFESNATISASDSYDADTIVIKGDDTVVNMTGGTVDRVITMDDSSFNMTGGTVNGLSAYDTSDPNIIGGIVYINLNMQSSATISGHATVDVNCHDSSIASISGNTIVNGCRLQNNSALNISGGTFQQGFFGIGNVRINVSGGVINGDVAVDPYFTPKPDINIIGYDLEAKPYGGNWNNGEVTGFWNDDTPFVISLAESYSYSRIFLYDGVVPPDCAFQPESDLSGDCVVNMADLAQMATEWLDDGRQ